MSSTQKDILRRTIEALEVSLRRYPENEKILLQLALAYAQVGRFDEEALEVYERAAKFFPSELRIQRVVSIAYLVNHSSEVVRDIETLSELDFDGIGKNIERLNQLASEYPDSPLIHRALGDLQLILGQERESIHHYRCAMALGLTDLQGMCAHFENVRVLRELQGTAGVFFADLYQRLGLFTKANRLFEAYASRKNPERVVLEKYAEFLQRRIEEAEDRSDANTLGAIRQLTLVTIMKGNFPEALTWARQLSPEEVGKDPRLAKDMARRLIGLEDFRLAFDYLSSTALDEEAKSILNEMTVQLEKRGELDAAVYILQYINENDELARESRQLLESERQQRADDLMIEIETELQMAELHWKNRRWQQAFERYLRVLELGYEDYRNLLEPLDLLIPRLRDVDTRHLRFLANFFADRREWRRCIGFAQMALQQDPDLTSMSQRVLQACERLLLENPNDFDVRLIHGDEQLRLGNIERAMQDYRKCAEAPEYKMKANRRLALANFRAGDLLGAYEKFRELPVLEQEDLERLYDLCVAFANNQEYKEAFESAKLIMEYDAEFRDISIKVDQYEEKMNEHNVGFLIDPKMRELIGDHSIGRYKYISKIGSGGMGVVHKVLDLKTNTVVAMKILREGLSSSGKAIDRFFREARIAATLHHKNIVNILDYNISNNYGQSYIAMEYVDGPSLRDLIERKFAETVDIGMEDILQALYWVGQLCHALDATHKKGIIHRDIKPDNILVGEEDTIKITDFGIVHIEEATFTPTGALIGTPRYMSPEQVHGGRIDARSDIYAVGIILYELLIGSPPFISGDISYQQVNVLPTPPNEICPVIPREVNDIIMRCLEKSPDARYQNALECREEIDEVYIRLGGNPDRIRPEMTRPLEGRALESMPIEPAPKVARGRRTGSPVPVMETREMRGPEMSDEDKIETPASFLEQPVGKGQVQETVDQPFPSSAPNEQQTAGSSDRLDTDLDID